jgi:hypothetical protein
MNTVAINSEFRKWHDKAAWSVLIGSTVAVFTWGTWLTNRSINSVDKTDLRETNQAIRELDRTVQRLIAKIDAHHEP